MMSRTNRNSIQIVLFQVFAFIAIINVSCGQSEANTNNELIVVDSEELDFELFYQISNRWRTHMTKSELNKVTSINDIISVREDGKTRDSFKNVWVAVLHNDKDVRDIEIGEIGQSDILTKSQIELLRSVDYSINLRITALSKLTDPKTGVTVDDSLVHYMTIIPEIEASYNGGREALIHYLKESMQEKSTMIDEDVLQPCKVFFTVTKDGDIENVKIVDHSGYTSIDEELIEVIKRMPREWTPAKNSKGENVHQEYVFFFGKMGC